MDKQSQVENINNMLEPCPRCGGKAEAMFEYNDPWEEGALRCDRCGFEILFDAGNDAVWKAIEKWNQKTQKIAISP